MDIRTKVEAYTKRERIDRIIEINCNHSRTPEEVIEYCLIQDIRKNNGEHSEVERMNKLIDKLEAVDKIKNKFNS